MFLNVFLLFKLEKLDVAGKKLSFVVYLLAKAGDSCEESRLAICGVHFC